MLITISPAGRGRYHARLGNRHLCTSNSPFLSSARVLLREGVPPETPLEMTREGGSTVDMRGTLGRAARWTLVENERIGPVLRPYRPFPADLRNKPQEPSPCV